MTCSLNLEFVNSHTGRLRPFLHGRLPALWIFPRFIESAQSVHVLVELLPGLVHATEGKKKKEKRKKKKKRKEKKRRKKEKKKERKRKKEEKRKGFSRNDEEIIIKVRKMERERVKDGGRRMEDKEITILEIGTFSSSGSGSGPSLSGGGLPPLFLRSPPFCGDSGRGCGEGFAGIPGRLQKSVSAPSARINPRIITATPSCRFGRSRRRDISARRTCSGFCLPSLLLRPRHVKEKESRGRSCESVM